MQRIYIFECHQYIKKIIKNMKKNLLLSSIIALLAITVVSCTKKADTPVPNIVGYYQGRYHEQGSTDESYIYISIKDDNVSAKIELYSFAEFGYISLVGTVAIKTNTFTGKFYGYESTPVALIEGGTISGTGKDAVLTGTIKIHDKNIVFSVKWISLEEGA